MSEPFLSVRDLAKHFPAGPAGGAARPLGRRGKLPGPSLVRDLAPDDLETRQTSDWVLIRLVVTVADAS